MFTADVINYFGDEEHWCWDSLEQLKDEYANADVLALPNDFDKFLKGSADGVEVKAETVREGQFQVGLRYN